MESLTSKHETAEVVGVEGGNGSIIYVMPPFTENSPLAFRSSGETRTLIIKTEETLSYIVQSKQKTKPSAKVSEAWADRIVFRASFKLTKKNERRINFYGKYRGNGRWDPYRNLTNNLGTIVSSYLSWDDAPTFAVMFSKMHERFFGEPAYGVASDDQLWDGLDQVSKTFMYSAYPALQFLPEFKENEDGPTSISISLTELYRSRSKEEYAKKALGARMYSPELVDKVVNLKPGAVSYLMNFRKSFTREVVDEFLSSKKDEDYLTERQRIHKLQSTFSDYSYREYLKPMLRFCDTKTQQMVLLHDISKPFKATGLELVQSPQEDVKHLYGSISATSMEELSGKLAKLSGKAQRNKNIADHEAVIRAFMETPEASIYFVNPNSPATLQVNNTYALSSDIVSYEKYPNFSYEMVMAWYDNKNPLQKIIFDTLKPAINRHSGGFANRTSYPGIADYLKVEHLQDFTRQVNTLARNLLRRHRVTTSESNVNCLSSVLLTATMVNNYDYPPMTVFPQRVYDYIGAGMGADDVLFLMQTNLELDEAKEAISLPKNFLYKMYDIVDPDAIHKR
jgi:hypothetical protein